MIGASDTAFVGDRGGVLVLAVSDEEEGGFFFFTILFLFFLSPVPVLPSAPISDVSES